MSFAEFQTAIASGKTLPNEAPALVQALWHEARGNWEEAHRLAQEATDRDGSWVHAYLHRHEGDFGNAHYWYARARRPAKADDFSLTQEREEIARALLAS